MSCEPICFFNYVNYSSSQQKNLVLKHEKHSYGNPMDLHALEPS